MATKKGRNVQLLLSCTPAFSKQTLSCVLSPIVLEIRFKIILPSTLRSSKWSLSFLFSLPKPCMYFYTLHAPPRSRDSSVGIATRYGLDGPVIESRWGEIFRTYPHRLRGPPSLLYNEYRVFSGGKGGRGVMLTTHLLLVPRLRDS